MADQVDRLILQVQGQAELQRLEAELQKAEKDLADITAAANLWTNGNARASTSVQAQAQAVLALQQQLKAAQAAQLQATAATGGLTQSVTTLGYAVNDADQFNVSFAAGVRSLSNNIPGLVFAFQQLATVGVGGLAAALTGPAGIILGITLLATLLPKLISNWSAFEDVLGLGGVRSETEEMEKLAKATARTAEETVKLNAFKERERVLEGVEKAKPKEVTDTQKAVTEALGEFAPPGSNPLDVLVGGLLKSRNPKGILERAATPDERTELERNRRGLAQADAAGLGNDPTIQALRLRDKKLREAIEKREGEVTRSNVGAALSGQTPGGLQGLINEIRKTPGAFPQGLADKLQAATPEGRKVAEAKQKGDKETEDAKKQAEKDQEQRVAEDERRSKQILDKQKADRKRREEELAKNLAPTLEFEALTGKQVGRDRVKQALQKTQGLSAADAEKSADAVLKNLTENFGEKLRTRAGEKGISLREAGADLLAETRKKKGGEAEKEAEEAQREADKALKEKLDKAKGLGADLLAESAAKAGGSKESIAKLLQRQGLDADTAKSLADDAFTGQRKSALAQALSGGEAARSSQVGDIGSLASRIQSGVGGPVDVATKQLREQQQTNEILRKVLARPVGAGAVFG